MLGEAKKMQEKTKEQSKIRKKNYLESNHTIASTPSTPAFCVGLYTV